MDSGYHQLLQLLASMQAYYMQKQAGMHVKHERGFEYNVAATVW
jgi:hypothetical protein